MSENRPSGNRRFVHRAVALTLAAAVLAVAAVWLWVTLQPKMTYYAAREAAFAREYEQMHARLQQLSEQEDEAVYYEAVISFASAADYNGDHDVALALLEEHMEQANGDEACAAFLEEAQALVLTCTYHKAMKLYEEGEFLQAARLAASIRQYAPAAALYQLADSAYQATLPTPTPSPTPSPSPAPSPTPLPTAEPVMAQQTSAPVPTPSPAPTPAATLKPEGRLAVGRAHTAVLLDDGTVRAFGDNSFSQTDTSSWQNVVYVAAGADHTLGLTADGRVLACGDNTHLQTDVSLFGGVKAIAAGDYDSFALMHTGEVLSSGYHTYDFLQEIAGAQAIWAGSYGLIVQTADGMHASHPSLALDGRFETAALSRGYAVGADEQGTTHATTAHLPVWESVVRLSAGENGALALTEDGQVLGHSFDTHARCSFWFSQPVLAAAAGANHYAFWRADGVLELRYTDGRVETHELP